MRVLFLGNHTVGVKALEAMPETEEVVGVIAHPTDPEDGVRYQSVYNFAVQQGWNVIRSIGKNPTLENFIKNAQPDLLWVTDYRYLLPVSLLQLAPLGAVNLHPSLLPKYRGRAPLNWAILKGERELGLTAHFIDDGTDTGDIIEQIRFELSQTQDVGDALEIMYPMYQKLTRIVLKYFQTGKVPRKLQAHSQATIFPARKPQDGLINWQQKASSIHNLIRAVAKPYPGAFTYLQNWKITIWKACVESTFNKATPGQIVSVSLDKQFCVACGEGILQVIDFTIEPQVEQEFPICLGNMLHKKIGESSEQVSS